MRTVKPDPKDPTWTFPYAKRATLEKIRDYFEGFKTGGHPRGWKQKRHKRTIKNPKVQWEAVQPKFRAEVNRWFNMKVNQAKQEGRLTPGKLNSLRMNATYYGTHVLTGKDNSKHRLYFRMKNIWIAFQDWEKKQAIADQQPQAKLRSRSLPL